MGSITPNHGRPAIDSPFLVVASRPNGRSSEVGWEVSRRVNFKPKRLVVLPHRLTKRRRMEPLRVKPERKCRQPENEERWLQVASSYTTYRVRVMLTTDRHHRELSCTPHAVDFQRYRLVYTPEYYILTHSNLSFNSPHTHYRCNIA